MVNVGSTLDFWVSCNYTRYPCLVEAPTDQFSHQFAFVERWLISHVQHEHYRLKVPANHDYELVTGATEMIGDHVDYSIVMDGTRPR
jgi:hypothetical protein